MSQLSTLLLIIFYLIFFKRNNDKKFWVIFFYVLLSFVADILLLKIKIYGTYFYGFFTLAEYTIFCYFIYLSYKRKPFKQLLIWCYPVFCLVLVYSIMHKYITNYSFDYLSSSFEAILLIILSILIFYEQLQNPEINIVYASKSFWIIIAILIYMSATLFLFISTSILSSDFQLIKTLWLINNGANIIKNILFAIAFSKKITLPIDSSDSRHSKIDLSQ